MTGQMLKEWRTRNNISQSELARLAGVSTRAVIFWEKDERAIPFSVVCLCIASDGKIQAWRNTAEKAYQKKE